MPITYPLAAPATLKTAKATITPRRAQATQTNPFTFETTVYDWGGFAWSFQVEIAPIPYRFGGAELNGFVDSLRGRVGTFNWSPPGADAPRGNVPGGSLLVSGAGQVGTSLTLSGALPWALAAGDWLSIGTVSAARLYRVTVGVASGTGNVGTVEIMPRLRTSPANGASVAIAGAIGCFRLDNTDAALETDTAWNVSGTISFSEAL
jgi:hypothetical protein